MPNKNPHTGSNFDDFLAKEGLLPEVEERAIKRVLALQVHDLMLSHSLTKSDLAARMSTSRAALDRLLDPDNPSVTLGTLNKAAHALGRRVKIELVA